MKSTMINVTPSKFWAFINRILRRKTYWTVAYNSICNYGDDWFDDDYDTKEDALKSAQDYFNFECQEYIYENDTPKMLQEMPITLGGYFYFNNKRRYIEAKDITLDFEYYRD
jgi:hypothetical protein